VRVSFILSHIEGAASVGVNSSAKEAKVVYDDTKTNPDTFVRALREDRQNVTAVKRVD